MWLPASLLDESFCKAIHDEEKEFIMTMFHVFFCTALRGSLVAIFKLWNSPAVPLRDVQTKTKILHSWWDAKKENYQITCRVCWVYNARPEQILTSSQSSRILICFFLGYLSCFDSPLLTSEHIWQLLKVKLFVAVPHNHKPKLSQGLHQLHAQCLSENSREKSKHRFTLKV